MIMHSSKIYAKNHGIFVTLTHVKKGQFFNKFMYLTCRIQYPFSSAGTGNPI